MCDCEGVRESFNASLYVRECICVASMLECVLLSVCVWVLSGVLDACVWFVCLCECVCVCVIVCDTILTGLAKFG